MTKNKMVGVSSAVVFISFLCGSVVRGMEDGTFDSRFEYEYKVLKQLVVLEMETSDLRGMVTSLTARLEDANTVIRNLNATMRNVATGSTYIRWGRKSCPDGTGARSLYDGYAGGSWYSHAGGGNNYLCLPPDPVLVDIQGASRSYIYGAEYVVGGTILKELDNDDVPCVVCITANTNVVMVPAKNVCHPGWTLEYAGYLMSSSKDHTARDYVCMDGQPQAVTGSKDDRKGALFYFVEVSCGSLPCDPYKQGYELTCAVCSLPPVN
ncbi:short-chain collagen C4-like [Mya arenaria]|uniref:short-chain collagen C4-like n=1 Tax=Mya arenaria TaxID=6604 RepID=UPI0022DFA06C|nr:short-chain collagen C4-like [Mya arenaria]